MTEAYTTKPLDSTEIVCDFVEAISEPKDCLELRRIRPATKAGADAEILQNWILAREIHKYVDTLQEENDNGFNIYLGANGRKGFGMSGDDSVELARCLFCDFDNTTTADALAKVAAAKLPAPSVVVFTGHGCHVYWRLEEPFTDLAAWKEKTLDLIALVGSDPKVHNPERILRVPPFHNWKDPRADSALIECNDRRYELIKLLSLIPKRPQTGNVSHGTHVNGRYPAVSKALSAMLAITTEDGRDGSNRMFAYCCRGVEHDLNPAELLLSIRTIEKLKPFPKAWSDDAILKRFEQAEKKTTRGKCADEPASTPMLVKLSDIPRVPIQWAWKYRIPRGRISLIVGRPGGGKSFATTDFAARVSTGTPWPDGEDCQLGSVLMICAEDDPADTIGPRVDANGGDSSKIVLLSMVKRKTSDGKTDEVVFSLADVRALQQAMAQLADLALIVVDPIGSFLGGNVDAHRDNEVRSVLAPLAALAANHPNKPAVLIVAHRRKSSGDVADDLALGSRAFTGLARAVWHFTTEKDNEARRLMLPGKQNLGPKTPGLAFTITGDPPAVAWEKAPVAMTADDALAAERSGDSGNEKDEAVEFLKRELADMQEHSVDDLRKASKDAGLSWRTTQRAASSLKVRRHRNGFGKGFTWRLPKVDAATVPSMPANRASGALIDNLGTNGTYEVSKVNTITNITPGDASVPHSITGTDDPDFDAAERDAIAGEGM
ncbi:MAG TPA: AAA family ATPase [Tepidisphaeraceae bacterium]